MRDLALLLLGIRAVKVEAGPGISPPYAFNFQEPPQGPLDDGIVRSVGGYLYGLALAMELSYNGICGVPPVSDRFASAFCRKTQTSQIWLEMEGGAAPRMILGGFAIMLREMGLSPCSCVLLITATLSEGGAEREAARIIRSQGLVVRDVLAIIDCQAGGKDALREDGLRLHALFTVTEFMALCRDDGCISPEQYRQVADYVQANRQRAETA